MEALCLERSLGGTTELHFSISTWRQLVLHPNIQLAGQNMETGQRLGNLLDEARPGEQGLLSSGRRRRRWLGETHGSGALICQPGATLSCWWHQEPALKSDLQ